MKTNEIRRTVEELVRVEYIAEDGTVFYNKEECERYEKSALFAISVKLKRLTNKWTSQFDLLEVNDAEELEIFDVQTEEDLDNLKRYLWLKACSNGASESTVKKCITSENGERKDFVIDNVTVGHEVLIFWSYNVDWFWTYKDGGLNGYFEWVKEKYSKITTPKEIDNKGE